MIQQGDVIIEVADIPKGAKKIDKGHFAHLLGIRGYVLAEGETTGHAHCISDVENVEMVEKDGMFFIRVLKDVTVTHEEHKPVKIPPGIYRVRKVREYDHFAEEARDVRD